MKYTLFGRVSFENTEVLKMENMLWSNTSLQNSSVYTMAFYPKRNIWSCIFMAIAFGRRKKL